MKLRQNIILVIVIFQLCSLVSLQRYVKGLSATQLATAVEKTKQRPHDRMKALTDVRLFCFIEILLIFSSL